MTTGRLPEIVHHHDLVGWVVWGGVEEPATVRRNRGVRRERRTAESRQSPCSASIERVEDERISSRLAVTDRIDPAGSQDKAEKELFLAGQHLDRLTAVHRHPP